MCIRDSVVVAQNRGGKVDIGVQPGSDWSTTGWNFCFFDPKSGNSSAKSDRHATDVHLEWWSARADLPVATKRASGAFKQSPREVKIGICVVDPGVNPLRCSIGKREVHVDDDAIVVHRHRNRYGLRFRLRRGLG